MQPRFVLLVALEICFVELRYDYRNYLSTYREGENVQEVAHFTDMHPRFVLHVAVTFVRVHTFKSQALSSPSFAPADGVLRMQVL